MYIINGRAFSFRYCKSSCPSRMKQLNIGLILPTLCIILQTKLRLCLSISQWRTIGNNISTVNTTFPITTQFHNQLSYMLNIDHINNTSQLNESQSRNKRITIPGTLWCGVGKVSVNNNDLGQFHKTDLCCRDHEFCPREQLSTMTTTTEYYPSTSETSSTSRLPIKPVKPRPTLHSQRPRPYEHSQRPPLQHSSQKNLQLSPDESLHSQPIRKSRSALRWDSGNPDCNCDRQFFRCLKNTDNSISRKVGALYFNTFHRQCRAYDHPIVRCAKLQGFVTWRCIEYQLDTTKPMDFQWRDNPYFASIP